jgi:putative transposase
MEMPCPHKAGGNVNYDPQQHHRRSIRMPGYDYAQARAYFVTICTDGRACLFDDPVLRRVVEAYWQAIPRHTSHVSLDAWVVMPNHLHGILVFTYATTVGARHSLHVLPSTGGSADYAEDAAATAPAGNASPIHGATPGSLGAIVGNFKAVTARRINSIRHTPGASVWQRNYYEHVVRNERALQRIREYIHNNSLSWDLDIENPANVGRGRDMDATVYYGSIWNEE